MSEQSSRDRRHREYVHSVRVAATLLDGPKMLEEISDGYCGYLRALGFFKISERQAHEQSASTRERLEELIERGWVTHEGAHYVLTSLGREEVNERLAQLGETGDLIRRFLQPQVVSKVTLGIHLALATFKMPAGILSGSVGLLNDAADTLLDGLSSLLVYLGLRFDKERAVNVVLVLFMSGTGALTFYEAVHRFFVPIAPDVDWYTFLAAILSALACLGLWAYQRYVGLRSGIMALITQSVDSRNHVIVAASVTAGLVGSLLRFPLLDTLVGLGVAFLILKSALELAIETVRSLSEEELGLTRFEFGIAAQYDKFRQAQLRDWMFCLVEKQGMENRAEVVARSRQALDFNRVPALRAMGLAQPQQNVEEIIEGGLEELLQCGWLKGEDQLSITDAGRTRLSQ